MRFLRDWHLALGMLAVIVLPSGAAPASGPDQPTTEINLKGVYGPFSFYRYFSPNHDELWVVDGEGHVTYLDTNGVEKRERITNVSLKGIYFASSRQGWAVGDKGHIFFTRDRGEHWSKQFSGVTENLQAITCVGESACWAVGDDGVLLQTFNAGLKWNQIKIGAMNNFNAVYFSDLQTGWIAGDDGLVLRTTDGGESWASKRVEIIVSPEGPFAGRTNLLAVLFINKDKGWVAGNGGIASTTDGGRTWKVNVSGDLADEILIGLVIRSQRCVLAIGTRGNNYLTQDGGQTWRKYTNE